MKISKNKFLKGFVVVTLLLALWRLVFPGVAKPLGRHAESTDCLLCTAYAADE